MNKKVVVAMSGGVDSSVAAALLKREGFEVIGLFMHNGVSYADNNSRSCCSLRDSLDAREVAYQLGINFYSLDFSKEFGKLMDYFVNEYLNGRTPNPCIKCNTCIKFGALLNYANLVGAQYIATGHYAQIVKNNNGFQLKEAVDKQKDQSYFLFELSQEQLSRALFPVGNLTKDEVRNLAQRFSLKTALKRESQDLCFIANGNLKQFMDSKLPSEEFEGDFVDTQGRKIGQHKGYIYYTIGQRKGLGIAKGVPLYVKSINPLSREVVVGTKTEILFRKVIVEKVNFCSIDPLPTGSIIEVEAKIRYKHEKKPAVLKVLNDNCVELEFKQPQLAVTPGQAACFYDRDILLGGGWIKSAINE